MLACFSDLNITTTRYHLKDHLQSTSITIGNDGSLYEAVRYTPYGDEQERVGYYRSSHTYTDQISDPESELLCYNARYYNPSLRTFTSPDPVATLNPEQVLTAPQQQNPYSYVANNPVVLVDPSGEATYYFDNGAGMTGRDYWDTGTYYQSQDRALLQNNAKIMEQNRLNLSVFNAYVTDGGKWDYKRKDRSYYFFDDELVRADEFGNLNYGYTGTAGGIGESILLDAGGYVEVRGRQSKMQNFARNFEKPEDVRRISQGAQSYRNTGNNVSVRTANTTDVAYTTLLQNLARALTLLRHTLNQLSQ